MPKNSSAARRQGARRLAAAEGVSYTAALRRIQAAGAGQARARQAALAMHAGHRRHPVEVRGCQACQHAWLAHYGSPASAGHGCVACEEVGRVCSVFVPGGRPELPSHVGPASDDPAPCPWLCGHGLDEHADGSGCYRCGCRHGEPGADAPGSITYHGYPADGRARRLVVIEAPAGNPVSVLPHAGRFPGEFAWGYGGAGPAALARCLLIAALGPAAVCPACHGAGQITVGEDGREVPCGPALADECDPETITACLLCDDGYRTVPHQKFKSGVVATWDQDAEWVIDRAKIITWLRDTDPGLAVTAAAWPGRGDQAEGGRSRLDHLASVQARERRYQITISLRGPRPSGCG